jgi:dTDP-4-amino-4,6-dideoxygalactose transaminase
MRSGYEGPGTLRAMETAGLAVLGAAPAFPDGLPFVRPSVPPLERVAARLQPSYERGMLTNGPLVRELEVEAAARLGAEQVVAVSSCTAGLMLTLRALGLDGPVVLPSFTFSASAHAVAWNGLEPRFVDCDAASFQVDPEAVAADLSGASAVLATHVFGAPCRAETLEALTASAGVPIVFDSAHAFGATRGDRRVGTFGRAEIFSMSPTKVVVAGEGGLVATNDSDIAASVRMGRDYGNPGDYDTRFVGLNARLSELHAALALESLAGLDERLDRRRAIAARYRDALTSVPGIAAQHIDAGDSSTFKDFTIVIAEDDFGLDRDDLRRALKAEGIDTRCYFSPPVHRQQSYASLAERVLPVTDSIAARVVSLPIYEALPDAHIDRIAQVIRALNQHSGDVRATTVA